MIDSSGLVGWVLNNLYPVLFQISVKEIWKGVKELFARKKNQLIQRKAYFSCHIINRKSASMIERNINFALSLSENVLEKSGQRHIIKEETPTEAGVSDKN